MSKLLQTLAFSASLVVTPQSSPAHRWDITTNSIYDILSRNIAPISPRRIDNASKRFHEVINKLCRDTNFVFYPIINTTSKQAFFCINNVDSPLPEWFQRLNVSNCMWNAQTGIIGCNIELEDKTEQWCLIINSFWEKLETIMADPCENY